MRILIVDDSPDALRLARVRLAKEGVDILCAAAGCEALEVARREKPDLVLLDVDMPGMSGFDVCRAIKADPNLSIIPVIFLSGSGSAEDKVRGLDMGAVDYVTKPFDAFELRARVRAALRTKRLQDLLAERAHIDPLTGLANRRALDERLRQEWARLSRHGGKLSLIMADIDNFKHINDTYGHSIGDVVLQAVAQAVANQCREMDFCARFGGEEFIILVPDESAANAARLAERCQRAIEGIRVETERDTVCPTASFGVCETEPDWTVEKLIEFTDQALYEAKRSGRNTVVVFRKGPEKAEAKLHHHVHACRNERAP